MTRFESLTSDLSALAELLEDVSALDPYCDDSPWREDGYETCGEWLRAKDGEKGTYPWRKVTDPSTWDTLDQKALLNLHKQSALNFDGKVVKFRKVEPLEGGGADEDC